MTKKINVMHWGNFNYFLKKYFKYGLEFIWEFKKLEKNLKLYS